MNSQENSDLELDTTPLPGVKADDPDKGAEHGDKSDDDVADDLARDPEVDSGDGLDPEADRGDAPDTLEPGAGDVAFTPFHPGRVGSKDRDLPAE